MEGKQAVTVIALQAHSIHTSDRRHWQHDTVQELPSNTLIPARMTQTRLRACMTMEVAFHWGLTWSGANMNIQCSVCMDINKMVFGCGSNCCNESLSTQNQNALLLKPLIQNKK